MTLLHKLDHNCDVDKTRLYCFHIFFFRNKHLKCVECFLFTHFKSAICRTSLWCNYSCTHFEVCLYNIMTSHSDWVKIVCKGKSSSPIRGLTLTGPFWHEYALIKITVLQLWLDVKGCAGSCLLSIGSCSRISMDLSSIHFPINYFGYQNPFLKEQTKFGLK